ncbi:hypothetical protein PMAC_000121 [Pneumocystis sp. 'macacae']|nr:hypothetical protein PMAC_000121 [Pneumocystis sp. 'macacae']
MDHRAPSLSPDEWLADALNTPFFMQGPASSENTALAALAALQHEGAPSDVAANFKFHGDECFRAKKYADAAQYYVRALRVPPPHCLRRLCLLNLAACDLAAGNSRRALCCCRQVLDDNPDDAKALYRAAKACLMLDRPDECLQHAARCVSVCSSAPQAADTLAALAELQTRAHQRAAALAQRAADAHARELQARREEAALGDALRARRIRVCRSADGVPDAVLRLDEPLNPASTLLFPVAVAYPLARVSDFVAQVAETATLGELLVCVLGSTRDWDRGGEYRADRVSVCMETRGGVVGFGQEECVGEAVRRSGTELVDGIVRVLVLPTARVGEWVRSSGLCWRSAGNREVEGQQG